MCERLAFLGVRLDPELNAEAVPDAEVSAVSSAVRVAVVTPREDVVIARDVRRLI